MTTVITSHGFDFHIQGDGFVRYHAREDFERGVDAIREELDSRPSDAVATLHKACSQWQAADCDGDRPDAMDRLECIGHDAATKGWHNPSAVFISVSAA